MTDRKRIEHYRPVRRQAAGVGSHSNGGEWGTETALPIGRGRTLASELSRISSCFGCCGQICVSSTSSSRHSTTPVKP